MVTEGLQRQNQTEPALATISIPAPALAAAAAAISNSIPSTADADPQIGAELQRVFASEESSASSTSSAFSFQSGLPSIQDILADNLTAYPNIKVVDDLGVAWLLRNFVISGETLLSFRITPQLEMTILEAIEQSLGDVIGVSEEQVFLSAIANMTAPLQLQGISWGASVDEASSSDNHAGLKAIRDALAILAGGYDNGHILVTPLLATSSSSNTLNTAHSTRRALQQQQRQREQQPQHASSNFLRSPAAGAAAAGAPTPPLVVSALFYGMAPSNASSLLTALTRRCGAPTAFGELAAACDEIFRQQFLQAGVPFDPASIGVAYKERPKVIARG
jgi:hypothetical protein